MGRRYWQMGGFDHTPSERADMHERLREQMIEQSGMNPEHLEGARRVLKAQHADRDAVMPITVNGDRLRMEETTVNAHGDKVHTAYRSLGGGRYEKVRIREAEAGAHTRVVTQIFGGR